MHKEKFQGFQDVTKKRKVNELVSDEDDVEPISKQLKLTDFEVGGARCINQVSVLNLYSFI
jgi:hypothetical protein